MKKNRLMRFAAVLLVLTLMTSCFVGGTFAKYVTTDSASDTARVAKWGIEVLASGNLFGTDYNPNSAGSNKDGIIALNTSTSVNSSDGVNVVAPGTKNDTGLTVAITGTPEVSYSVTSTADPENKEIFLGKGHWGVLVKATGLNDASNVVGLYKETATDVYTKVVAPATWDGGVVYYELHDYVNVGADYYPIDWYQSIDGAARTQVTNIKTIMTDMATDFVAQSGNANASADLKYTLTWEWPYSVDTDSDKADTILGNLFAGNADDENVIVVYSADDGEYKAPTADKYCLDIHVGISLTVEQTD